MRDAITIELGDRKVVVKKALVGIRDRFHIDVDDGPDMKAHGNIVDHEYEIEQDGDTVAEVSKKWFRIRDSYGVEIDAGVDPVLDPLDHRRDRRARPRRPVTSDPPAAAPDPAAAVPDPAAILRSRNFVGLLVFAAVIGVIVSFAGWLFLEGVHQIQLGVFSDLPDALGYSTPPSWWYPVVVGLAGIPVAFAIRYLPGNGGHVPAHGLQVGGNEPAMLPGIVLAAIATLGLGVGARTRRRRSSRSAPRSRCSRSSSPSGTRHRNCCSSWRRPAASPRSR